LICTFIVKMKPKTWSSCFAISAA